MIKENYNIIFSRFHNCNEKGEKNNDITSYFLTLNDVPPNLSKKRFTSLKELEKSILLPILGICELSRLVLYISIDHHFSLHDFLCFVYNKIKQKKETNIAFILPYEVVHNTLNSRDRHIQ